MCSLGIEPTTICTADAMLYHWATQESSHTKTPFRTKFLRGTVCRFALRKPVLYVGYKVWFILEKRAVRNLAEVSGSPAETAGGSAQGV